MIKGIDVTLYEIAPIGVDAFNKAIYGETPVVVHNVLVEPMTSDDIVTNETIYGKKATYRLCIPKGDAHKWENVRVSFMGAEWRTFGFVQEWIEANVPGYWNKKIMVERYG